ncbi:MAG: hypothetical protein H7Z43_03015 [Clostridia bacterium]|nr:hypothetical protein [Deltaproteobacteria bacterium]
MTKATTVVQSAWHDVLRTTAHGTIRGSVRIGEDVDCLATLLGCVRDRTLRSDLLLLTHADLGAAKDDRESKRQSLERGTLKRYVIRVYTEAGPRVVKVAETVGFGNTLHGLFGSSVARREHDNQLRAEGLELAATQTSGFLELRRGLFLKRAIQIQTELDPALPSWTDVFDTDRLFNQDAAVERAARALAATHALGFFHADLKGFHAFVPEPKTETYGLLWLDLGRVGFSLTPRKRIINLYQALRFVIPRDADERFVTAYCQASGWHAGDEARAVAKVRKFLDYKLRTHLNP